MTESVTQAVDSESEPWVSRHLPGYSLTTEVLLLTIIQHGNHSIIFISYIGALYSYGSKIEKKFHPVSLSNGLAWSLDNTKMYFIDSTKRVIYSFDFDI